MRRHLIEVFVGLVLSTGMVASAQHKPITTRNAPKATGPYSQAIEAGNMLFLAGQIAIDPKTQQFNAEASIEDQTRQTLENLKAVLTSARMTMANVVSASVFMKDLNDFDKMNAVYATYFKGVAPPARVTVQVAALPKDAKIEISFIAMQATVSQNELQYPYPSR